jgi:YhcH/YjgK/YiaL family protein
MILDSLENSGRYLSLHPLFKKAFDFLKNNDLSNAKNGKLKTDDPRVFFMLSDVQGKDPQDAVLEAHKKYIDIQTPLAGVETIGWKAEEDLMIISQQYSAKQDVMLFHDFPTAYTKLYPGQFAIFFPEEGHAPGIGQGSIRKVIAKILFE